MESLSGYPPASSWKGNILLLLGTVFFLLFSMELGIRFWDMSRGHGFFSDYRDELARIKPIIPYRIFGWELYREIEGVPYIVSSQGELFPLQKPAGTIRIVAFGGSTTKQKVEGVHYPLRLQELLAGRYPDKHIEVINVGEDAYATTHMITLLAFDVVSWDPDFVILSENANDLVTAYFDNSYTPDYSNKYGSVAYMPRYEERFSFTNVFFRKSRFYWFVKGKIDAFAPSRSSRQNTRRTSYGDEPPESGQVLFRRNLNTFVAIAQAYKIPVILASQPFNERYELWDFNIDSRKLDNAVYPLLKEHALHHRKFNEILQSVAKKSGSYFLDNDALFAGDQSLFIDSLHYTRDGTEKLAGDYYQFFVDHKLIDSLPTKKP